MYRELINPTDVIRIRAPQSIAALTTVITTTFEPQDKRENALAGPFSRSPGVRQTHTPTIKLTVC